MKSRVKPIEVGTRFGKLVVLEFAGIGKTRGADYRCRCDCGNEVVRPAIALRRTLAPTRSCGCLAASWAGRSVARGGASRGPYYAIWSNIVQRCCNPRCRAYPKYGGRGIRVCERWRESIDAFLEDMGPRPSPAHSVDRIDNDGPYSPENCRWATRKEQSRNRPSRNVRMTCNGRTMLMVEWAEELGIKLATLHKRRKDGWSDERAILTPVRAMKRRQSNCPP